MKEYLVVSRMVSNYKQYDDISRNIFRLINLQENKLGYYQEKNNKYRIYNVVFKDSDGFDSEINCFFDDKHKTINSIWDLEKYLANAVDENGFNRKYVDELLEDDNEYIREFFKCHFPEIDVDDFRMIKTNYRQIKTYNENVVPLSDKEISEIEERFWNSGKYSVEILHKKLGVKISYDGIEQFWDADEIRELIKSKEMELNILGVKKLYCYEAMKDNYFQGYCLTTNLDEAKSGRNYWLASLEEVGEAMSHVINEFSGIIFMLEDGIFKVKDIYNFYSDELDELGFCDGEDYHPYLEKMN